jgi:hypothetical protein
MKKLLLTICVSIFFLNTYAQIGIKADGLAPIPSAQLEVQSTNKAFYPPRMTTVLKNAIPNPQAGAIIFDTDQKCLSTYDGTQWNCMDKKRSGGCCVPGDYQVCKLQNPQFVDANDIQYDSNGNFYVVGRYFGGAMDVYNFDGTLAITLPITASNNGNATFLLKYNSAGTLIWSTRLGNSGVGNGSMGFSLAVDVNGVTIAGYLAEGVTVYNARTSSAAPETSWGTFNNTFLNEGFVVRYNTSGVVQWTSRMTGGIYNAKIASQTAGNAVFISFLQNSSLASFATQQIFNARQTGGQTETYWGNQFYPAGLAVAQTIIKYDLTTGAIGWVAKLHGTGDIAVSASTNSLFANFSSINPVFDNAITTALNTPINWGTINAIGQTDTYLQKMNTSTGAIDWVARQGGGDIEGAGSITADNQGNCYLSNVTKSSASTPFQVFQGRTSTSSPETAWGNLITDGAGNDGIYTIKYNNNGNVTWANSIVSNDIATGLLSTSAIKVNTSGEVYLVGRYNLTSINLYHSKQNSTETQSLFNTSPAQNTRTVFIAKYNRSGKGEWIDRTTSTGNITIKAIDVIGTDFIGCGFGTNELQLGSKSTTFIINTQGGFLFKFTPQN